MACERYREALADVAAGMPAPAGVESHLASCEACQEELAALRRALALADAEMVGLLSAEPSPELAARIRQALAEPEPAAGWRFRWLWPATAAAVTLLVAFVVWLGHGPSATPRVAERPRPSQPESGPRPTEPAPVIPRDPRSPGAEGSARVASPSSPGASRASEGDQVVAVADWRPPGGGRRVEALLRFATLVNRRAVAPDSLLVADLSAPLPEPDAIEIAPLEIVPLDPVETSGTD